MQPGCKVGFRSLHSLCSVEMTEKALPCRDDRKAFAQEDDWKAFAHAGWQKSLCSGGMTMQCISYFPSLQIKESGAGKSTSDGLCEIGVSPHKMLHGDENLL